MYMGSSPFTGTKSIAAEKASKYWPFRVSAQYLLGFAGFLNRLKTA